MYQSRPAGTQPKIFEKIDNPDYDYFLFSNLKQEDFDTSWKVITVDIDFLKNHRNDIIRSRYFKFMGWKYIKEVLRIEYDIIYFCDATRSPDPNTNWEELSENICVIMKNINDETKNKYLSTIKQDMEEMIKLNPRELKSYSMRTKFKYMDILDIINGKAKK